MRFQVGYGQEQKALAIPDDELENALATVRAMAPSSAVEVAACVEGLRLHFRDWDGLSEDQSARVAKDWLDDFSKFPLPMLETACRRWRNTAHDKMPTPGQLKSMVKDEMRGLLTLRERVHTITEIRNGVQGR